MAKKNFSGGLDSLFGGPSSEPVKKEKKPATKPASKKKPTTEKWWEGLPQDKLALMERLAAKENKTVEELVLQAVDFYLDFQPEIKYKKD